jgi:hypothetical protein
LDVKFYCRHNYLCLAGTTRTGSARGYPNFARVQGTRNRKSSGLLGAVSVRSIRGPDMTFSRPDRAVPRSSIRLGIGLSSLLTAGRISDICSIARSALPMRELLCSVLSAHLDPGKLPAVGARASQQVHTLFSRTLSRLTVHQARNALSDLCCFISLAEIRLRRQRRL